MKKHLFSRRLIGLGAAIAAFAVLPAQAASAATSSCQIPVLSLPFVLLGDHNGYALPSGESADNFGGAGWTLSGGAHIVKTKLADGTTGNVLDLPPGARAVSPPTCVATLFPSERMMTRYVGGGSNSSTSLTLGPVNLGLLGVVSVPIFGSQGWTLSAPITLPLPGLLSGLTQVDFTFTSSAKVGDLQVYNLYVDPRMRA